MPFMETSLGVGRTLEAAAAGRAVAVAAKASVRRKKSIV
jgi:hypothetical protein